MGKNSDKIVFEDYGIEFTDEDFKAAKVFTRINAADADGWREIRVGFHYYNNREDIDRFFEVINQNRDK